MKQTTFASLARNNRDAATRRERFLADMETEIASARLLALAEPHHPKVGKA